MTDLILKIPQKKTTAWVTETTPNTAHAWLNSLPLSDSGESARELYRSLYTLNRLELDSGKRAAIVEMFRTPVNAVTAAIQQTLGQHSLPLTPNLRRMTEIIRELNREMAVAYKIVLLDQLGGWKQRLLRKPSVLAIERAMRYSGEVLVHCYHAYLPFPSQVWLELNELYRYSEDNELLQAPVEISLDRDIGATTIGERYKQICLLGLCNPYQLPQGDARKIHLFLYRWANTAAIKEISDVTPAAGCFQIDLLRDAPPVIYNRPIDPVHQRRARILDAAPLVTKVKTFIQRLEDGESAAQLDLGTECLDIACLELLRRMLRGWGAVTTRQHSRSSGKGLLSLCVGINATHFFAGGQRPFSPPVHAMSSIAVRGVEQEEEPLDIDVDAVDDKKSADVALAGTNIKDQGVEDYHVTRWEIADQSASGMFLRSGESPGMKIRVGDLLGVQFGDDAEGDWWPAAVRRMQGDATGKIEIGIELLASQLLPAAVCAVDGIEPFHAALLIPALETLDKKRPRSLVVPRGIFREQAELFLVVEGQQQPKRIRPLKIVEHSSSYEQLYFAEVNAEGV